MQVAQKYEVRDLCESISSLLNRKPREIDFFFIASIKIFPISARFIRQLDLRSM